MNVTDSMGPELYGSKLSIGFNTEIKSNHSLTTSTKMKLKKKYHTAGTVPKSNRAIVEKDKIDTHSLTTHFLGFINPAGTPGYRNGTESFFGLKGRPSVVRDV
jgi:hypothetical protein